MTADDPDGAADSSIEGETTRLEAVQYLEGASGHGVSSLVLLLVAVGLFAGGLSEPAIVIGIVAYGVAANGLSIYAWDELRRFFEGSFERDDEAATRTLTPHRVSAEMKAELASGAVMVGGFTLLLGVALALVGTLGFERAAVVAAAILAVGNLVALGVAFTRS